MKPGRASSTAALVVRALALLSRERRLAPLVPTELAEANEEMLAVTPAGVFFRRALACAPLRALLRFAEGRLLPGIALHYLLRKRRLEELVRSSLDAGFGRVVVLGAGLDTLALRLHRDYPHASFVEVDHPATQAAKRRALDGRGDLGSNLELRPCDLDGPSLRRAVAVVEPDHEARPTLTVAEGLLMYLRPSSVEALLARLAATCRGGSASPADRLVFTFMATTDAGGPPRFEAESRLVHAWLRLRGEPFRWGCDRRQLPVWLRRMQWEPTLVEGAAALRRRYLAPAGLDDEPLAVGEGLALAETAAADRAR